jgi:hypothetical protein
MECGVGAQEADRSLGHRNSRDCDTSRRGVVFRSLAPVDPLGQPPVASLKTAARRGCVSPRRP